MCVCLTERREGGWKGEEESGREKRRGGGKGGKRRGEGSVGVCVPQST